MVQHCDVAAVDSPNVPRRPGALNPAGFSRRRVSSVVALIPLVLATFGVAAGSASASTSGQKVALFAAETPSWIPDVQNKILASGAFAQVTILPESGYNAGTPSLAELQQYSSVFVWTDSGFQDSNAVGDVLADYIDGGGHVVVSTFAGYYSGTSFGISGRFASGNYLPTTAGSYTYGHRETLVKDAPASPLLAGVTSFDGGTNSWHNSGLTVKSGSTLVAHWTDGEPLVVYRGNVVELNFLPTSDTVRSDLWKSSTDGAQLMVNALKSNVDNTVLLAPTVGVGQGPVGVAVTADGSTSYVVNRDSGTVSVIKVATNAVVATIAVGGKPRAVAVSPDGSKVYVTDELSPTMSVIRTVDNTVTTITVGSGASAVAFNPKSDKAYVTNSISNTVSVIKVSTGTVLATFAVGRGPSGVAFSPDGSKAGVTNLTDGTVSGINASTDKVVATIKVGAKPQGGSFSPDGTKGYVTNAADNTVSVINVASRKVIATVTVGSNPHGLAVSPDGTKVYVANTDSNTVSVISVATNTVTKTLPVGQGPIGVAFNLDGTKAFVTNNGGNTVSVINS